MAFDDRLYILKPDGSTIKTFARKSQLNGETIYRNLGALGSPTIMLDQLKVRSSERGRLNDPSTYKGTHNLKREVSVLGTDGKVYDLVVNLTVTLPGGNVITDAAIKETLHDVIFLVTQLDRTNSASEASDGLTITVGTEYVQTVRILEV